VRAAAASDPLAAAASSSSSARAVLGADDAARADERCEAIRLRWRDRLRNCSSELRAWQPLIELRAMALAPLQQMEAWIKFGSLCRKSGRLELCRTSLSKLLPPGAPIGSLPVYQQAMGEGSQVAAPQLPGARLPT